MSELSSYDVCIIGSGAAGGVTAKEVCEGGAKVILLQAGREVPPIKSRYYSHDHDPGANEPLGVYCYERIVVDGAVQWKRHVLGNSTRTGGGMQIAVVDMDGDGDQDIVVAGKCRIADVTSRPAAGRRRCRTSRPSAPCWS